MRRLDGLSAFLVHNERPRWYQHTLKIAILDYGDMPIPRYETLVEEFSAGIRTVPMLQWKLARIPLGINHPVWVQADDFDIRYHLRRVTCPTPGDDRAFSQLVSELYAYPLDQSVPLWLCWIVDGLADGKVAVISLFHHAYTDGSGAARLLERILQPEKYSSYPIAELKQHAAPGPARLLLKGLLDLPLLFCRELPGIVSGFRKLRQYRKECEEAGSTLPPGPADAPFSPFNTALSHRRTFVYKTFPLDDIKAISKRHGVTINDLFVAVCAGAFRKLFENSAFDVDAAGPLVASLPVNLRPPPEEDDLVGNLLGNGYMWVPSHITDPMERLKVAHDSAAEMKKFLRATREANITRVLELMPELFARVTRWVVEHTRGRVNQAGNLVLSNVAGPREPLKLGSATVSNRLSIGQVTGGVGLNITVWSYAGNFNVCIMADAEVLPDGWILIDYINDALDEYRDIA